MTKSKLNRLLKQYKAQVAKDNLKGGYYQFISSFGIIEADDAPVSWCSVDELIRRGNDIPMTFAGYDTLKTMPFEEYVIQHHIRMSKRREKS
jgi:hypothetical protein